MPDKADELTVRKQEVDTYLDATQDARALSERDRDYIDGKQWTAEEEAVLRRRGQAPIVINRMAPKHQGLLGLWDLRRTDPKAFPRTKKHEKAAHAITDALRYVADNTDFHTKTRIDVADNFFGEGTAGAIVDGKFLKNGEYEIRIQHIPWDRIYFDPYSRRHDFSDARYKGVMLWMDFDQFTSAFPDADIDMLVSSSDEDATDETFQDKPRWIDGKRKRIRVAMHYFVKDEVWHFCYFTEGMFLIEPEVSPYLDEDGDPVCPIELVSANIDRDNNRYGDARNHIHKQDEINHRRSKALYLLSRRQTYARKGVAKDIAKLKREAAKPDGHLEFPGGEQFGKDFGFIDTADMATGQFSMYQDAKAELDSVGFNAQLAGERQQGDLSGKAINLLQQAGTIELNRQYTLLANWEKSIYRQVWGRIKQFWTEEKWIRITDDHDDLRWVGLNTQITAEQWLQEQIQDEALNLETRRQAMASLQFLQQAAQGPAPEMLQAAQADPNAFIAVQQALQEQQAAQQQLNQIVEMSNPVAEIDVDIVIDQSFDVVNIEQEQFQIIAQFAQSSQDIDIIELIELSQIRKKDELIEKIEKRRAQAAEATGNIAQIEAQERQSKVEETQSRTLLNQQKAIQTAIENTVVGENPDFSPNVVI